MGILRRALWAAAMMVAIGASLLTLSQAAAAGVATRSAAGVYGYDLASPSLTSSTNIAPATAGGDLTPSAFFRAAVEASLVTRLVADQLRAIHTATHPAAQNTPGRQRPALGEDVGRPAAGFETEVLHLALDAETRQETPQLDADPGVTGPEQAA